MNTVEQRAAMLGEYIIDRQATVRDAAKRFGISKSTVHKDVTDRLRGANPSLSERHIRGGEATREKYLHIRQRGMS